MLLAGTGDAVWAFSNSMLADNGIFVELSEVLVLLAIDSGSALVGYMVVSGAESAGDGLESEVPVDVVVEFVFLVVDLVSLGTTVAGVGAATLGAAVCGLTKRELMAVSNWSFFLAGTELVLLAIDFFPPEEIVSSSVASSAVLVVSSVAAVVLAVVPAKCRALRLTIKRSLKRNWVLAKRASIESTNATRRVAKQTRYFILE